MRRRELFRAAACALALAFALPAAPAPGATAVSQPRGASLVEQPAYGGMRFYVYRPANIPSGWYATYDGYPVIRGKDGVWYYGSREGAGIVQTGHVVGSIVPELAGLVPWTAAASVAPLYPSAPARPLTPGPIPLLSPSSARLPAWAQNSAFLAVGNWGGSVDRMGILSKPALPVAWKGERPQVIYAWTGSAWYQVMGRKEGGDPVRELRGRLYDLTLRANRSNAAPWDNGDIALLARYAAAWGYRWMGQIFLVDQFGRPANSYPY